MLTKHSIEPGIIQLELLPDVEAASVIDRLDAAIQKATSARFAVAYWTVGPEDVSSHLARVLGHDNGFLCVDIHYPTDLDQLHALFGQGVNLRLHLRHLATKTERQSAKLPQHLMHSKLLLMDNSDGTAEIWVGSHNWTRRALLGPNIEASAVIQVEQGAPIYRQVSRMLDFIHSQCEPYKPALLSEYKQLQRPQVERPDSERMPVIELEGVDTANIQDVITIFGTRFEDLEALRSIEIEQPILLYLHDTKTERVTSYDGTLLHIGLQRAANPAAGGLEFSPRRFVKADGKQKWSTLELLGMPSPELLQHSAYFVTIQIQRSHGFAVTLHETPREGEQWVPVTQDPLIDRVPREDRARLARRPLVIKVPSFVSSEFRMAEQDQLLPEAIVSRRGPFPLVVWRHVSGISRDLKD